MTPKTLQLALLMNLAICFGGCATARDTLLPKTGEFLNYAHAAQNSVVDARETVREITTLVCSAPEVRPTFEPMCLKAEAGLAESKVLLNFSADGLEAASKIYNDVNDAVK
jgi:uncharacterized protein YceK